MLSIPHPPAVITRRSHRQAGKAIVVGLVLTAIFVGMVYTLLHGTGMIKNWGLRTQEREADLVQFKATGDLLAGNLDDASSHFPTTDAGKAEKEIYLFLRDHFMDQPKVQAALDSLPETPSLSEHELKVQLQVAERALAELTRLKQERDMRAGRLLLRIKALDTGSDRIKRRLRELSRAFEDPTTNQRDLDLKVRPPDETHSLFGGPERLFNLKIDYAQTQVNRFSSLLKHHGKYRVVNDEVVFNDPNSRAALDELSAQAKLSRLRNQIEDQQKKMDSAVAAERRGDARRLGL